MLPFEGLYTLMQSLQHTFHIALHINIKKSDKSNAQGFKSLLPRLIFMAFEVVRVTVNFNGKHELIAEEINYIVVNWSLS